MIYHVSGLLETIFANESSLKEKLEKIAQYRQYIADISVTDRYIQHFYMKKSIKNTACEKIQKKNKISRYGHISASKMPRSTTHEMFYFIEYLKINFDIVKG